MEDIIKNVVAKALRKKGAKYKLSDNSKQATNDFTYANKITSKIHQYAKKNWRQMANRRGYERLLKVMMTLVRNDEEHELGKLRLGYGDVCALKFFRFNSKKSFFSLIPWQTSISYNTNEHVVKITAFATEVWSGTSYDDRVNRYMVRYHVLRVPFELTEEFDFNYSKELEFVPCKTTKERSIGFSTKGWDNCLIVVIGAVDCWFKTSENEAAFKTANTLFMAADVLDVFRIRNGELLQDTVRTAQPPVHIPEDDMGVDWD